METAKSPRERILNKAYELFYTQGYHVTGINQILDEANVAKASLYQHFGSKEELGLEYIKKVRADWTQSFDAFLAKKSDPSDKILAAFDFLANNMRQNNFRGCRFLNLLTEVDDTNVTIQNQIREHKAKLREKFKALVEQVGDKGKAHVLPDSIYLLYEAALTESKLFKDTWPVSAAKKTVGNLLDQLS
jgi:AcrR family transcriptional regulator